MCYGEFTVAGYGGEQAGPAKREETIQREFGDLPFLRKC
jgi:hypothetical protein